MAKVQRVTVEMEVSDEQGRLITQCVASGGSKLDGSYDISRFLETVEEMIADQAAAYIEHEEVVAAEQADDVDGVARRVAQLERVVEGLAASTVALYRAIYGDAVMAAGK